MLLKKLILNMKFNMQNHRNWSPFIKVRYLDNSEYYQKHIAHLQIIPLIDIFPLDNVPKENSVGNIYNL